MLGVVSPISQELLLQKLFLSKLCHKASLCGNLKNMINAIDHIH